MPLDYLKDIDQRHRLIVSLSLKAALSRENPSRYRDSPAPLKLVTVFLKRRSSGQYKLPPDAKSDELLEHSVCGDEFNHDVLKVEIQVNIVALVGIRLRLAL